jgi:hypothetical protein
METISISCTPRMRTPESRFRSARLTCPEMNKTGVESSHAPATPVTALVPPGPVVTMAALRWLVTREYASAAMAAACSCKLQT